jgi:hypothetical protein
MGGLDGLLVLLLQVDDVVTTGLSGAYAYWRIISVPGACGLAGHGDGSARS